LRFFCDSQKNRRKCIKTLGSKVFFEVSPVYSIVFLQKKTFDGESVCGWGRANNRARTRVVRLSVIMLIQYHCRAFEKSNGHRENAIRQTKKRGDVDDEMYVRMYVLTFFERDVTMLLVTSESLHPSLYHHHHIHMSV
jgi:hypothetical protein